MAPSDPPPAAPTTGQGEKCVEAWTCGGGRREAEQPRAWAIGLHVQAVLKGVCYWARSDFRWGLCRK
jgi:hypothetical protein